MNCNCHKESYMRAITEVTFDCEKFQQKLSLISEIHIY
jgi:hypothetical protein